MNKIKFYQFLILGLLISNIILLAFLFFGKGKGRPNHTPREIIINKLNFTEEQSNLYIAAIGPHRSDIDKISGELKNAKNTLFHKLSDAVQDSIGVDSLQNRISNLKRKIETVHYNHFLEIKSICTPEQLPAFEELTKEMAKIFAPHGKRKSRKPKK